MKFDNDFEAFVENRSCQIKAWKENQKYFLEFLKDNKLSKLYAFGSYYYLLFKILRIRDLNANLLLSYLIFYPYNLTKKILFKIKEIFKKN
jgi:chloramphenicol O-acetyltransferase